MKHFDEIFELAADGYGIVTAAQAREIGVTTGELDTLCHNYMIDVQQSIPAPLALPGCRPDAEGEGRDCRAA